MSIILRIDNQSTSIEGKLDSSTYKKLKRTLGYIPEDAIFKMRSIKKQKGWSWDGYVSTICYNGTHCKCALKKEGTHFPTGLISKVLAFLKKENISYKLYDIRKKVEKNTFLEMSKYFEERDYQREVVDECLKRERGIVKMATGSGKSAMSALLVKELSVSPFIFYVPSIDLLKQAQDEFQKMLVKDGEPLEVGIIGGGHCDIEDINIMTIQTAVRACGKKYIRYDEEETITKEDKVLETKRKDILDLIQSAKGIICDETQHWACESCQAITDYSSSARYRFGISATPFRDKNDDILIDSCFGRLLKEINASYLIERGFLVKPDIYFIPVKAGRKQGHKYQTIYSKNIVENVVRNDYISKIARKLA